MYFSRIRERIGVMEMGRFLLAWKIYFFNRLNVIIFPLSWKKCLLDAVVIDRGSQIAREISLRNQPGRPSDSVPLGQLLLRI